MIRHIFNFLKLAIPIAIVVWLVYSLTQNEAVALQELAEKDKNWGLLIIASFILLLAVMVTFFRWWLLVRTLDLPFRLRDAFRLGFLSYLLNFISPGSVGGDLFKAYFIARDMPNQRAKAVATIVIDRVVGLFALLLLNSVAIIAVGLPDHATANSDLGFLRITILLCTCACGIFLIVIQSQAFTQGRLARLLVSIPKIGPIFQQLLSAAKMYQGRIPLLCGITLMSLVMHAMYVVALYLVAISLFDHPPTLAEHYIIVPLGMVAGALPFTPNGLGTFEIAMQQLYEHIPTSVSGAGEQGLVVALVFRLMTIAVAAIGVCYYLASKKEVSDVMQEVEQDQSSEYSSGYSSSANESNIADDSNPQADVV